VHWVEEQVLPSEHSAKQAPAWQYSLKEGGVHVSLLAPEHVPVVAA